MERADNERWLDDALAGAFGSDDTRPDFEVWKAQHPEAVQKIVMRTPRSRRSPAMRNTRMNHLLARLAMAAAIVVAAIIGIAQLNKPRTETRQPELISGPVTHTFSDGSIADLADGAQIRTLGQSDRRGFEHIAGKIDVSVAKGQGDFVVTTPCGQVRALGTEFTLELADGTTDSGGDVQLLAVEVTEGKVEVSNAQGTIALEATQNTIVEKDTAPYDFRRDESLPQRLRERIASAIAAMQAGDAPAYMANYNIDYMFRLIKGREEYDPQRFGGSEADLERIRQGFGNIAGPEELARQFAATGGIEAHPRLYVRSVGLNEAGDHAQARVLERRDENHLVITTPQWHYFDNDWWQIDD